MNQKNYESIKELNHLITEAEKIALISHKDPDGDALGSCLGFYHAVKDIVSTDIYISGKIPYIFEYMKGLEKIKHSAHDESYDLVIVFDSSDEGRISDFTEILNKSGKSAAFDHHKSNTLFCDINIVETGYSSTGEIVFEALQILGHDINTITAECLYTAIITDTGKFTYENTNQRTFFVVSELLKKDIDKNKININLYSSESKNIFLIKAELFAKTEFHFNDEVALTVISKEICDKYNVDISDIDGVVEALREINGVEISCVLKELDDKVKISMRSKSKYDVSELCEMFNGGGHIRAAGCQINDKTQDAKEIILKAIKESLNKL